VRHGAHAHLADVAGVTEQLVLIEDLLGHLLWRTGGDRATGRAQRLVVGTFGRRPAALAADPVHHLEVGGGEGGVGGGCALADERMGVDRHPQARRIVSRLCTGAAVELHERREPLRLTADDRDRQRKAEQPGSRHRRRGAADRDPHGQGVLERPRPHTRVLQRRAVTA